MKTSWRDEKVNLWFARSISTQHAERKCQENGTSAKGDTKFASLGKREGPVSTYSSVHSLYYYPPVQTVPTACNSFPTLPPSQNSSSPSTTSRPFQATPATPCCRHLTQHYREIFRSSWRLTHLLSCEKFFSAVLAVAEESVARAGCLGSL